MSLQTPILFLIFNRPDTTLRVFEQIQKVKPARLFLAADGPRLLVPDEAGLCEATRKIVLDNIDWDCEIKTLLRSGNLGCGKAVSEAITWFFSEVEEGIILEDDTLPNESFFQFCEELLIKYRGDKEVMTISGSNLMGSYIPEKQSYYYGLCCIWGWATWKRAWELYDFSMKGWSSVGTRKIIKKGLVRHEWYNFYYPMFEAVYDSSIDTWDVQWLYTILINGGKSINPSVNLIKNIGFDIRATHTSGNNDAIVNLPLTNLKFPLIQPKKKSIDIKSLKFTYAALHAKSQEKSKVFYKIIKRIRYFSHSQERQV